MPDITAYQNQLPALDIRQYLNGRLSVWGVMLNAFGKQQRRFTADINGRWQGNQGELEEHFVYDDGEKQQRVWQLRMEDDHHFTGTAHDIVGTATGQQYGNTVNMRYVLRVALGKMHVNLDMDDWLYRVDDKHVINHTIIRKFGLKMGELHIGFIKHD